MLAMISHAWKALVRAEKCVLASCDLFSGGRTSMGYFILVCSRRQLYGMTQLTQKIMDVVWIMDGSALNCMEILLKYKYFS